MTLLPQYTTAPVTAVMLMLLAHLGDSAKPLIRTSNLFGKVAAVVGYA